MSALFLLIVQSSMVFCSLKVYEVNYINVHINVYSDGFFDVTEEIQFNLIHGIFSRGWRSIPFTGIDDIEVLGVECAEGLPLTYEVTYKVDSLDINWRYKSIRAPANITFIIKYRVYGAITAPSQSQNMIDWLAVGLDWEVPIGNVNVTIDLPGNFIESPLLSVSPEPTSIKYVDDITRITFTHHLLPPHTGYRVIVIFPKIYDPPVKYYYFFKEHPASSLVILLCSMIVMLGLWLFRGRPPKVNVNEGLISLGIAPSNLKPAEAAFLIKRSFNYSQVLSTLIDLARRGFLVIEYDGDVLKFKLTDEGLSAIERRSKLKPFEIEILKLAHEAGNSKKLGEHWSRIKRIGDMIEDELVKAGYFRSKPSKFRFKIMLAGIAVSLLSILILLIGAALAPSFRFIGYFIRCFKWLLIGLALSGVPITIVGFLFTNYTVKGAKELKLWNAYINRISRLNPKEVEAAGDVKSVFESSLPIMIAINPIRFTIWASSWSPYIPSIFWPYWFIYTSRSVNAEVGKPTLNFNAFIESFSNAIETAFKGLPPSVRAMGGGVVGGVAGAGGAAGGAGGGGGGVG